MIRRKCDNGIVGKIVLFQILKSILKSLFKLQLTCDICLDFITVCETLFLTPRIYQVLVADGHGIGMEIVSAVSAYRHVVYVERLMIAIQRKCSFHHLTVAFRPVSCDQLLHTVSVSHEALAVAEKIVGDVSAVIQIVIIMKGHSVIAVFRTEHGSHIGV